jgi:hypothetical protein
MPDSPLPEPLAALPPPPPGSPTVPLPAELDAPPLLTLPPPVLLAPALLPRLGLPLLLLGLEGPGEPSSSLLEPGANASPSHAVIAELAKTSQAPIRI